MADRLLTQDEYETLFRKWKRDHGELGREFNEKAQYQVPRRPGPRMEMYAYLINDLIVTYGYTEEDLRTNGCFGRIINTSIGLKHKNKKKLSDWKEFAETDLNEVIDSFFPKEMAELKQVPEIKAKSTKKSDPYEKKRARADIIPDVPDMDKSKLTGPVPVTVIDESFDILAYSDREDS